VEAEAVVELVGVGEEVRELGRQLGAGVGGVGGVVGLGALDAGARAIPGLGGRIAGPDEEGDAVGLGARAQDEGGVGLEEAGQVDEVGVLAERVVGVAVAQPLGRERMTATALGPSAFM
jgi:hypothetical protein